MAIFHFTFNFRKDTGKKELEKAQNNKIATVAGSV